MYDKKVYQFRKENNLCTGCGGKRDNESNLKCSKCSAYMVKYLKERGKNLIQNKQCIKCKKLLPENSKVNKCTDCLLYYRQYNKQYSKKLSNYRKIKSLCVDCGNKLDSDKKYCKNCLIKHKIKRKKFRKKLYDNVFAAYGNVCKCCNESNISFLCISPIYYGDNSVGRSSLTKFYCWLRKNNYPIEFQILCKNCSFAKRKYGQCPHQLLQKSMD